ncbi:unnamed protein product [marine sediment metagenome]|uniref:Uncharacterized protein n=1 Tax=marine sediment metagenome TaxID=412755 RepID=X0V2A6_9ZZZZ
MEYSAVQCFQIIAVGCFGAFVFILLTTIVFNHFVLHTDAIPDALTFVSYIIAGGIMTLLLQLGEVPELPQGFIWVSLKGFSWTGIFVGLVDIARSRRRDREKTIQADRISLLALEGIRKELENRIRAEGA